MAMRQGRDVIMRMYDNAEGEYLTIAGLRARDIRLRADAVDSTAQDNFDGWRRLLSGAGKKRVDITGDGVFTDVASDTLMRETFFARDLCLLELDISQFGLMRGDFFVSQLAYGGREKGEAQFSITLSSAGPIAFAPGGGS